MATDSEAELQAKSVKKTKRGTSQRAAEKILIDVGSGHRACKVKTLKDAAEGKHVPKPKEQSTQTGSRAAWLAEHDGKDSEAHPQPRQRAQSVAAAVSKESSNRKQQNKSTDLDEQRSSKSKRSQSHTRNSSDTDDNTRRRNRVVHHDKAQSDDNSVDTSDDDFKSGSATSSENESEAHGDFAGVPADQVAHALASEIPKIKRADSSKSASSSAANLWDIDDATVEKVSSKSSRISTRPPSSDSDSDAAIDDDDIDNPPKSTKKRCKEQTEDIDDEVTDDAAKRTKKQVKVVDDFIDDEDCDDPPKPTKKHRKASSRTLANWKNETPTIKKHDAAGQKPPRRSTVKIESDTDDKTDNGDEEVDNSSTKWPAHAKLHGKGLTQQNSLIRALCRNAIKIVEMTIVTTHAWPELNRQAKYHQEVLLRACRPLMAKNKDYRSIRRRLKSDDAFTKVVGKWVMDRLPHACGVVKARGLDHIALFQLGIGDMCAVRVHALMSSDRYIYPGCWSLDEKQKPMWVIKASEIYLNPGLIAVLKSAYFATQTAFGHKFKAHYVSSHPTRLEPEFPAPLVSLAATGLYAALHAWQSGSKIDNEKFDGDQFKSVYDRHLDYLESIKNDNANAYHSLMSRLYMQVMGSDVGDKPQQPAQDSALGLLDLSEFK